MTIEERLRDMIIDHSGTVKAFADEINVPYGTLDSILRRGIQTAKITNIISICKKLDISADALADGKIMPLTEIRAKNAEDIIQDMKNNVDVLLVDGEFMTEDEFLVFSKMLDNAIEMVKGMRK